jgi:cytochrome c peroxidase
VKRAVALALVGVLVTAGVSPAAMEDEPVGLTIEMLEQLSRLPGDIGPLPAVPVPADNPQEAKRIELGRRLFFDTRLSRDRAQSCASCHDASRAFCDGRPRALGFHGRELARNSPTVLNAAFNSYQFWDGRAATLEEQAGGPMLAAGEMNMTREEVVARVRAARDYRRRFRAVFGGEPSFDEIAKAIASFERTLVTPDSAFDRYARGERGALSAAEKRGLVLFVGKAACTQCHKGPNFTDDRFHRVAAAPLDVGRFAVSAKEEDRGAFKTPTLRNAALTAPYMHDGRFRTLQEVVDFYDRGGDGGPAQSPLIFALDLTTQEKADLVSFLSSLSGRLPVVRTH